MMRIFYILLALLVVPIAVQADTAGIEGYWMHKQAVVIRIQHCGALLCGSVVSLAAGEPQTAPDGKPICGTKVLSGFSADPNIDGQWSGGTLYQAALGKTYSAQLTLDGPDRLKVLAYIGLPQFGKEKVMHRIAEGDFTACKPVMPTRR